MRKLIVFLVLGGAVLLILAIVAAANLPVSGEGAAYAYLEHLGWEPERQAVETEVVTLPVEFDDVYLQYNQLQQQAGFDLTPYRGQRVVRYTFAIKGEDALRANVLCQGKKVIGGDLMTTAIDGFMEPLRKR